MRITWTFMDKGADPCQHIRFRINKDGVPTSIFIYVTKEELEVEGNKLKDAADLITRLFLGHVAKVAKDANPSITLAQLRTAIESASLRI